MGFECGLVNDVFAVDLWRRNTFLCADILRKEFPRLVIAEKLSLVVAGQDEQSFVHVAQSDPVFAKNCLQSIVDSPERIDEVRTWAAHDKEENACENSNQKATNLEVIGQVYGAHEHIHNCHGTVGKDDVAYVPLAVEKQS